MRTNIIHGKNERKKDVRRREILQTVNKESLIKTPKKEPDKKKKRKKKGIPFER